MTDSQPSNALHSVTIAIPTLNRAGYLQLALESALHQSYNNVEVIVSNNASTDDTARYLSSVTHPRLRVLTAATGEYFLLLSDDDLLEPEAIQQLVAGYTTQEGVSEPGFVYCGGWIIDSEGSHTRVFKHSPHRETAKDLIPAFFGSNRDLWLCGILFRTADVLPGFSAEFSWAPDSRLWIDLAIKYGSVVFIGSELVSYRIHQNATSSLPMQVWKNEINILAQFAIQQYSSKDATDRTFASQVNKAVANLIVRSVPIRINQSLGDSKLAALREYARQMPHFLSPTGARCLTRGLASLFLSKESKAWLSSVLRKSPTSSTG
jgi:glycosyltransferase involved in cell wall biosynthesis